MTLDSGRKILMAGEPFQKKCLISTMTDGKVLVLFLKAFENFWRILKMGPFWDTHREFRCLPVAFSKKILLQQVKEK